MKFKSYHIILIFWLSISVSVLYGQDSITVQGIIRGINNHPVSDVSVSVEGVASSPEITDSTGSFTLRVPEGNSTLIITPPSKYKKQTFFLGKRLNPEIKLTELDMPDTRDMAKYLFGYLPKRDFVSSMSTLSSENIQTIPNQSIDEYFSGNASGMWSIGRSGMPGSGAVNYIRGIHTMNGNSQPLYIIDGLPIEIHGIMASNLDGYAYNPLSGLHPDDITNITILKDNVDASLYGVRGSNGIILIETLQASEVQTSINVSYRTGISMHPDYIPQLNSYQYRTYAKEVLMSSPYQEEALPSIYPGLYYSENDKNSFIYNNNTNWQDIIFRNAVFNDLYFRINGGDEIAKYGLSIGYQKNQGVVENTNFSRFSVRFVGSFNMFRWLKFNVSSNLSTNTSFLKESARSFQTSPILTSLLKNPLMNPYMFDDEGNELDVREDVDELGISNPLSVIEGFEAKNRNSRFLTSVRIEGDLSDHFKFNSLIGINFNSLNENIFMPNLGMELYYDDEAYNVLTALSNNLFSFANDNYLSFDKHFGSSHELKVNVGTRINTSKFQYDFGIAKNAHENDEYRTLQSGTSNLQELGGENGNWNRLSFYGNVVYTLMDKYGIILGSSLENSTRIGSRAENVLLFSDVPFGLFYGSGIFWRISNEPLLRNISWIDNFKLRFSYGKSGNDDIGNYNSINYLYLVHYRNTTGMVPGPYTDESLSYEEYYHMNAGFDFATWGNRFSFSADLFNNKTNNLLVFRKQDFYLGHEFIPVNDGKIENKGWEMSVYSRMIQTNKFYLDLNFNLSHFSNKVVSIANDFIITPFSGGEYITRKGDNMISFYGYQYKGVYSSAGEAQEAGLLNAEGIAFGAGDAVFADLSGPEGIPDGMINKYDRTIIGSPIPDYTGGISAQLGYANWFMDIMFQGVYGNELFNYVRSVNESMTNIYNQSKAVLNRWQYDGHEAELPRSLWGDPMNNSAFSSRWIEDGSYLRLKNITLGYKIPDRFLMFRNAMFYISGINLLTLTNYLGYDPEFAISFETMEQGLDYGLTPYTKTFLIGLKLGL